MRCYHRLGVIVLLVAAISTALSYGEACAAMQCYGCHGSTAQQDMRPIDSPFRNPDTGGFQGSHRDHMKGAANAATCAHCHPGAESYRSGHRDGLIKLSSAINDSPQITQYPAASIFNNRTSAFRQTATPALGSCSSVNCHFEAATPVWGSDPAALSCSSCHGSPPGDGSHLRKHDQYLGSDAASCGYCHGEHSTFDHATSAGKRPLTVRFARFPNTGGSYTGDVSYPDYLPSQHAGDRNGTCIDTACHSDGRGGPPRMTLSWSDSRSSTCYSCHGGRTVDSTPANCAAIFGVWSSSGYCTPDLTISSNGHHRLVGPQWIRKYPCSYCHSATADASGTIIDHTRHVNGAKDVVIDSRWNIDGRPAASYDPATKVCNNVYCHSDGTADPESVRPFAWTSPKTDCNSCHGHAQGTCSTSGCHDGRTDAQGTYWEVKTGWPVGQEWMSAMPMYPNEGPGTSRANSHARHLQTNFTCDICHANTVKNGACTDCHAAGIPTGSMNEVAHIDATYHVNKKKDVVFNGSQPLAASYNPITKTCSGTSCHSGGTDPVWGGSVNDAVTCLNCHGTSGPDVDDYASFNGTQAKINLAQWVTTGHGRYSSAGRYPATGNPAANFPGNPCWYCHDNSILHKDPANPFRLRMHNQFARRFEKECMYCHMERTDAECLSCHVGQTETLAPQATGTGVVFKQKDGTTQTRFPDHTYTAGCTAGGCHDSDTGTFADGMHKGHNTNAGSWTPEQKSDVKNSYMMMGVCLQCHDDDSNGQCTGCHTPPPDQPNKYSLGFDAGAGLVKPKQAKASGAHFGYKHYRDFMNSGGWTKDANGNFTGIWKGGKFCWDCHDPHGDGNIAMIQDKVATTTDGVFGIPRTTAAVTFTDNKSGSDYARKTGVIDGICNVCHAPDGRHYTSKAGDGHNYTRRCTSCHEHRFSDSHASQQSCDTCHLAKPVPKHTAFGLPRDCTKCHAGTIGNRMDIIGQMKANSHHVQGVEITDKVCYQCHWEATPEGLINTDYHSGYNYKTYTSVRNAEVDLVVYGPGYRPTVYREYSTADGRATVSRFLASSIGTTDERANVGRITNHCLGCHSDQNNNTRPFGDCKTPRQYAWDLQSIASRYTQTGTTSWGKYNSTTYPNANRKDTVTKAFSAHGNAVANQGGFDPVTGLDAAIPNSRNGTANIQCFDCHNSHGSKVVGITSSYVTFNGTNNGANLKETKQFMGGYAADYKATANTGGVNPYNAGAGECFDCHTSPDAGTAVAGGKTPWGYASTFGATAPIIGDMDTPRFGQGMKAKTARYAERAGKSTILGGHLQASVPAGSMPHLAKESGTASGGTTTSLDDGGKSWAANGWKDKYLLMDSGPNGGQLRRITGNGAASLTCEPFAEPVAAGDSYRIVPYAAPINGLCTPCHDPHGVSRTLGSDQAYAVPLLKGTWLTSPFRDDAPEPTGSAYYIPQSSLRWRTERSTLNGLKISETDSRFAGLCTGCHAKANLTDGIKKNTPFKSLDRIHESVKGWGNNGEHAFSCSKCHQPHSSGLPRLMRTNCLDFKHRGDLVSGGSVTTRTSSQTRFLNSGRYPSGYSTPPYSGAVCHGGPTENGSADWPNNQLWNTVTPW